MHYYYCILSLLLLYNLVSNVGVMDYVISDHYSVECTLNISKKIRNDCFQLKRALKHIDMGVFVNDIKVTNTYMKTEGPSVDKMLDAFNSTLSTILNKHAPLKKIRVKTQPHPWYIEDIKDARLHRRVCERVWRHTGVESARIAYKEARNLVNKLIKRIKIQ